MNSVWAYQHGRRCLLPVRDRGRHESAARPPGKSSRGMHEHDSRGTHGAGQGRVLRGQHVHVPHHGLPAAVRRADEPGGRAARRAAGRVAHRPGRQPAHSRPGRRGRHAQHAGLLAGEQRQPHPARPEEILEGRARRRRARRRPPGGNGAGQPQVDVQRPLADAGGTGLAPVPQRGRTGGAAHLRQARVRRHLLRPVLAYRAGRQEVPERSLRRQRQRQPLQGLLRGRGMRDPAIPGRSRRRRQRAAVLQGRRR